MKEILRAVLVLYYNVLYICNTNRISTMATTVKVSAKKPTAFRLNSELIDRLKELAKKEHRSLNNYVETVLMSVAYSEPNNETIEAMNESKANKDLESLDLAALKKYVASL